MPLRLAGRRCRRRWDVPRWPAGAGRLLRRPQYGLVRARSMQGFFEASACAGGIADREPLIHDGVLESCRYLRPSGRTVSPRRTSSVRSGSSPPPLIHRRRSASVYSRRSCPAAQRRNSSSRIARPWRLHRPDPRLPASLRGSAHHNDHPFVESPASQAAEVAFFRVADSQLHSNNAPPAGPVQGAWSSRHQIRHERRSAPSSILSSNERLNAELFASMAPDSPASGAAFAASRATPRPTNFVDYQGHRQAIERTVISTVPTRLQRTGVFSEAVNGRVPDIYDPITRTPFPNRTIPIERFDSSAAALLSRYPQPTGNGTANNYRRVGEEINDQNDGRPRCRHFGQARSAFGRLAIITLVRAGTPP